MPDRIREDEPAVHQELFRSLMRTPHRKFDELVDLHKKQFERDPNFYAHLAIHAAYLKNCPTRDINEVFIAALFVSPYTEHREAAYVMFQDLPPMEAVRVVRLVTGADEVVSHTSIDPPLVNGQFGITVEPRKYGKRAHDKSLIGKPVPARVSKPSKKRLEELWASGKLQRGIREIQVRTFMVRHPYFNQHSVRGWLKEAIRSYLLYREQHPAMMEGALLRARKYIKELYGHAGILPQNDKNGWINQYLFFNKALPNSRLEALKKVRETTDPTAQAVLIFDSKLPIPMVLSALENVTPSVGVAMADGMSAQELAANVSLFYEKGLMENPEIERLVKDKLKSFKDAGKKTARMDSYKGSIAAKKVEKHDAETAQILTDITDSQLKKFGKIKGVTLILIDKSTSMTLALEAAKVLGAGIAQACDTLIVYLFDNIATKITWTDRDGDITKNSSWDKKFAMFRASGGTDPSQVIKALMREDQQIDRLLCITDGGENDIGRFGKELQEYEKKYGYMPTINVLRVGEPGRYEDSKACDRMEAPMKQKGIEFETLEVHKLDRVSLPNVLGMLSRGGTFEFIQDILALPLPTRADWDKKNLNKNVEEVKAV